MGDQGLYTVQLVRDNDGTVVWEISVEEIEQVAGILAASVGILDDLNASSKDHKYSLNSVTDVSDYLRQEFVLGDDIKSSTCGNLRADEYGQWMKSSKRFLYNLYGFKTAYFFQGIISACHAFGVDFRDYIYGLSFDAEGKQYTLAGYVISPYQIAYTVDDLSDVEEEEADDENIIEPLRKDY